MNEDYLRRISGKIVDIIPANLKDASYKEQNDFLWALDWKNYYQSLYWRIEDLNGLIDASVNYSEKFQKELMEFCKDYLTHYIMDMYLREKMTLLYQTFKRYANDPDGLEWTPENIDRYLWDWYNKVDVDPWTDKKREYRPDWFDYYKPSVVAFITVWGKMIGVKLPISEDKWPSMHTAIKMLVIQSRVPNYYD